MSPLNDPLVVWLLIALIVVVIVHSKQLLTKPRMHATTESLDLRACFSIRLTFRYTTETATSSSAVRSAMSLTRVPFSLDCSPFLHWDEDQEESEHEKAVVFRSLVATLKIQPALDASLEAKVVKFLESVNPEDQETADDFLDNCEDTLDASLTEFVQSIEVLISSTSQGISSAAMKILGNLIDWCSQETHLQLVKADLIPQLIGVLNPLSLSPTEAVDIHEFLLTNIQYSFHLATPDDLEQLEIEDHDGQQAVHKTILQQVLAPSEQYISHLCVNRSSIVDGDLSTCFMVLLTQLLGICPYYQPTMDIVLHMPVVLTIASSLTFFEVDESIHYFPLGMDTFQQEWNETRGEERQMGKIVNRMLRMEGIEDVVEGKLRNDKDTTYGEWLVESSIEWNHKLGMNLPKQE
ncbi:hypothetical protein BLNAU_24081 [Blattamonas nauphoetae]|uniref:Uncharacterized protein n=1 Tax=Blattamonas nauphoetae TaxID=2049346 RepID=A0ABQ9WNE9_9EUKA|nr:hypothetical protein BLNAU_24081 [Blattamonas nauphoetae]